MGIAAIDHWVLVVKDLEETFAFYRKIASTPAGRNVPAGAGSVRSSASARRRR